MSDKQKRENEEIVAAVTALLATRGGQDESREPVSRWGSRGVPSKPWSRRKRAEWRDRTRQY